MTLPLAKQLALLGTENAFAVSKMANDWAKKGNAIYPFHLGDIDMAPPAAITENIAKAIRDGKNTYCPGAGIDPLREQLASHFNHTHGTNYTAAHIAIQTGGKPVIAKFLMAVMNPGEEVLYPVPGFPIYHSQIRYQGGVAVPYYYSTHQNKLQIDLQGLKQAITPNTRAIIYNNYHNPTGACATDEELTQIADLVREHRLWLLNDDAYYQIRYDNEPAKNILSQPDILEQTINLFTFSKQFAMTGWRVGAAIGPTTVIENIAKMNTNIESCTSHFTQQAIADALAAGDIDISPLLTELDARRQLLVQHLNSIDGMAAPLPASAFYVYCDMKNIMQRKGHTTIDQLMRDVLYKTGVSFCTGEHFGEPPTTTFARFAFSGISPAKIEEGMTKLKAYAAE